MLRYDEIDVRSDFAGQIYYPAGIVCPPETCQTRKPVLQPNKWSRSENDAVFGPFHIYSPTDKGEAACDALAERKPKDQVCAMVQGDLPTGRRQKETFMKHQEMTPRVDFCFSGPERIPAGAALGRAAATIRIFPAPLPGADIRAPAERSAPHPRARARRGRTSPTCFQQDCGSLTDHEIPSETGLLIWRPPIGET